jgi:putative component of toxin-antitoxin plasmid stabilization module
VRQATFVDARVIWRREEQGVGYRRFLLRVSGVVVALICACMAIAIGYRSAQEVPAAKSPAAKL